jgi:hypothetical protein
MCSHRTPQIPLFDFLPSSSTTVPNISFPAASGSVFASSVLVSNVGAVFTGFITFPSIGKWLVEVKSDDGTRFFLWPDGSYPRVFISNDFLHAMQARRGFVNVQAQLTYAFSLEYFQAGGGSGCTLSWQPPDGPQALDLIPSSAFTRPAAAYVPLPSAPSAVVSMSMGSLGESGAANAHSCFISTDTSLWCHGSNTYGQLALNDTLVTLLTPFKAITAGVSSVALGGSHSCITNSSGALMCWGADARGQIGDGGSSVAAQSLPTVPSFPLLTPAVTSVVSFSLGYYHTCAVDAKARMFCWGDGGNGRLGQNCSIGTDDSFNLLRSQLCMFAIFFGRHESHCFAARPTRPWASRVLLAATRGGAAIMGRFSLRALQSRASCNQSHQLFIAFAFDMTDPRDVFVQRLKLVAMCSHCRVPRTVYRSPPIAVPACNRFHVFVLFQVSDARSRSTHICIMRTLASRCAFSPQFKSANRVTTDSSSINVVKAGMTYNAAVASVTCSSSSTSEFTCTSTESLYVSRLS